MSVDYHLPPVFSPNWMQSVKSMVWEKLEFCSICWSIDWYFPIDIISLILLLPTFPKANSSQFICLFFLAELTVVLPSVWAVCVYKSGGLGWAGNGASMENKKAGRTNSRSKRKDWLIFAERQWKGCVFMLRQDESQLGDLLTLPATLSEVQEDQLKKEAHNDTQLF